MFVFNKGNLHGRHSLNGGNGQVNFTTMGIGFERKIEWGILNGGENDETALNENEAL